MERRSFIRQTLAGSALTAIGGLSAESFSPAGKHLTVLHTNDVHSYVDPFPPDDPKNPNRGGVANRAVLIENIRRENPNVLLFDAGDIFQGTPYFNFYGGELEMKLMSLMRYDLGTMGNHDFDNGVAGFYKQLPHAKFDFVSANYDFRNTLLDGILKPYKLFERQGIKIGVFGLGIELKGLVIKQKYGETVYNDPVGITQDVVKTLKETEKCDLVICLSHLGYEYKDQPGRISDVQLARLTKDIDLIIGGHTHTFLDTPAIVKNADDKEVLVNQAGCYGLNLGRIDFYFDAKASASAVGRTIVV
jgi:5'-nucleotidase